MKVTVPIILDEQIRHRFWENVEQDPSGCWFWTGATNASGYGTMSGQRQTVRFAYLAHRVAWTIVFGDIEPGMLVCHTCDNPPCCNPMHFFLGDDKANADDRDAKGRTPWYIAQMKAKTHCPQGRPYDGDNLVMFGNFRMCKTCKARQTRVTRARHDAKLKNAALSGDYLPATEQDRETAAAYHQAQDRGLPFTPYIAETLRLSEAKVQYRVRLARAAGLVPLSNRMRSSA